MMFVGICSLLSSAFAQSNNPFDQVGIDFIASVRTLDADREKLLAGTLDDEAINTYVNTLPLKVEANPEVIATVTEKVRDPKFDTDEAIEKLSYSEFSKQVLKDVISKSKRSTSKEFGAFVIEKVDAVLVKALDRPEEEAILSKLSILYHISQNPLPNAVNIGCYCNDQLCPCAVAGGAIGILVGTAICGPLCGFAGAIVGTFVGSLCD
jgi:hypothetical protein